MSTPTASAGRLDPTAAGTRTGGLGMVLVFAGLSVALAAAATLGGVPPALVPFVLALGPLVFALVFAWREGDGADPPPPGHRDQTSEPAGLVRTRRPARRMGTRGRRASPSRSAIRRPGVFDKVFPAIVIVPLIVLIPAFAEEIAWRGYAVTRLLPSMSPAGGGPVAGDPVGGHPPLPAAARSDERGSRRRADRREPARLLGDPHLGVRRQRRQRPACGPHPRRPQRGRAADGRPRGRPRLDHQGSPRRRHRPRCRPQGRPPRSPPPSADRRRPTGRGPSTRPISTSRMLPSPPTRPLKRRYRT